MLAYNKVVVQCKDSQAGGEGSTSSVSLSDVVSQLETVAVALGISLSGQESEAVNDRATGAVLG